VAGLKRECKGPSAAAGSVWPVRLSLQRLSAGIESLPARAKKPARPSG
jgi:hypothetical protein